MNGKRCPRCGLTKRIGDYYQDKTRGTNGRYRVCKSCHIEIVLARRAAKNRNSSE